MKSMPRRTWNQSDILISLAVLIFLMVFTYGLLFLAPYPGFNFNASDGVVSVIFEDLAPASVPHLEVGDILKKVGSITFEEYSKDITINFFENYKAGDVVEIDVERDGKSVHVPWVYPGFTSAEFSTHFFNGWWLAYIFWCIGIATQLFIRPKDQRWRLFVAANYLIAMFIMLGTTSWTSFLGSAILMRVVAWLLLPVYLHFHWIFPRSLRPVPRWMKFGLYGFGGVLAVLQLLRLVPNSGYLLAVVLAFGGSILLLIAHFLFQREHRRELGVLAIAAVFSFSFTILVSIIASRGPTPSKAAASLFALPILPITYFYILYRRSLGGLELRTNRAISLYVFLVILAALLFVVEGNSGPFIRPEAFLFIAILIALVTAFLGILIFPTFQKFVERRLLGIQLPAQKMIESYSARIVSSNTLSGLLKLLDDEVFPSLLIRQYVFVRIANSSTRIILSRAVDLDQVSEQTLQDLLASSSTGQLLHSLNDDHPLGWVRLILPLRVGPDLIGACLLGRRDPDDHYPQAEFPVLQSLANQTAVALSNIVQTERLKVMYEANIHRYEQERLRLARDLHDSVLNEMGAMLMKQDSAELSPGFQQSFDGLIVRLREIVTDLRPPMLIYGLKYALDGLADNLSERNHDRVRIISEIHSVDDCRYPENVEQNLYRIVQEACENALKYARAKTIQITAELLPRRIDIEISDDGIGLNSETQFVLDEMVANKHYGLAGMHERADLIGAAIRIDSQPNKGTQIHVFWEANDSM